MNRMPNTEIDVWGLGGGVAKGDREMREEIERLKYELAVAQAGDQRDSEDAGRQMKGEGFVLVPIKPSREMVFAGEEAMNSFCMGREDVREIWKAMLRKATGEW